MKISNMLGERTKTIPSEAKELGYANLLRAGYIKQVCSGIFSLMPLGKRVVNNIERVVREEMNKVGGQEVLLPVVMPKELWDESGRYESIGEEMARFTDRSGKKMLLGMTHEEAAVHLARNTVKSYNQLPFMIYQIQIKFRDEARSRGGLIRVREFTMKDGYSFHTNEESLNSYYDEVHESYNRIFKRIGMKDFVSVESDTGMMGGSGAHEFMLLTKMGEDSIVLCEDCQYKANMEVAESFRKFLGNESKSLEKVFTGEAKTIEEVSSLLKIDGSGTCKAVLFGDKNDDDGRVVVFIRGDLEVNEAKLKRVVKKEVYPLTLTDDQFAKGNIGPLNLNMTEKTVVVYDESIRNEKNLVIGANEKDYHFSGFEAGRDLVDAEYSDVAKVVEGERCVKCGGELKIRRGVEIGNIFKLGDKYTKALNMSVLDNNGRQMTPIMGCYGIGIGRALGSIAEESSDERGLVWNEEISPFSVYLCPIKYNNEEVKDATDKIYKELLDSGVEVLLDDRNESPGYKFAESELIGVPIRVVVSPRTLETGSVEISYRQSGEKKEVKIKDLMKTLNVK